MGEKAVWWTEQEEIEARKRKHLQMGAEAPGEVVRGENADGGCELRVMENHCVVVDGENETVHREARGDGEKETGET